ESRSQCAVNPMSLLVALLFGPALTVPEMHGPAVHCLNTARFVYVDVSPDPGPPPSVLDDDNDIDDDVLEDDRPDTLSPDTPLTPFAGATSQTDDDQWPRLSFASPALSLAPSRSLLYD